MKKPTENARRYIPTRVSRKDLARLEAGWINKDKGATWMPRPVQLKLADQKMLETVYGPPVIGDYAGRCYKKPRVGVVTQPMDAARFTTAMINQISVK